MRVDTASDGTTAVVRLDGRLDAECATYLGDTLDELLRAGTRSVVVDLSRAEYVSSAGMKVLTRCAHDIAVLRGELFVAPPPPTVIGASGLAGLGERVLLPSGEAAGSRLRVSTPVDLRSLHTQDWRTAETMAAHGHYEVVPREAGATLACRVYGERAGLEQGGFGENDCHDVAFPERAFGVGLGAIGDSFEECRARVGELVAASGAVIYLPTDGLPTDGARTPDYLVDLANTVPHALLSTGLACEGGFSHLIRFGTLQGAASVPLAELASVCLDNVGAERIGVVMVAETAGLVGACLRRSPALPDAAPSFETPALREWLTFTAEPAHRGSTSLVAGVLARRADPPLAAHLRPLRRLSPQGDALLGHLHAAVFSYRPVPLRTVAMHPMVMSLLQQQTLRGVLHLLHDEREGGVGESEFVRGLIWAAPIGDVEEVAP